MKNIQQLISFYTTHVLQTTVSTVILDVLDFTMRDSVVCRFNPLNSLFVNSFQKYTDSGIKPLDSLPTTLQTVVLLFPYSTGREFLFLPTFHTNIPFGNVLFAPTLSVALSLRQSNHPRKAFIKP